MVKNKKAMFQIIMRKNIVSLRKNEYDVIKMQLNSLKFSLIMIQFKKKVKIVDIPSFLMLFEVRKGEQHEQLYFRTDREAKTPFKH